MGHYFKVYKEFVSTCFSQAMSFRVNFIFLILMDLVFYATNIFTVTFIFDYVDTIGPWNRDQFLFFTAFMIAVDHMHMTFCSENFWWFSDDLKRGNLDFILLKPMSSIFTVFFRRMRPGTLPNIITTWGLMIYFGNACGFVWWQWALLPPLLLISFAFIISLEIIISISMFWLTEGHGVNFFRMQLQRFSQWPDFVFMYFTRKTLTFFFPILLVGSAPVRLMYDLRDWKYFALMLLYMGLSWIIIKALWSLGLKQYESASS